MLEQKPLLTNLIFTRKSDVPDYLHCGNFYQSLNDGDEGQISVPGNTLKPNTLVENNDDLEYLLSSLRFWSVDKVFQEVVMYSLDKNPASCTSSRISVLESFKADFRYVDILLQMIPLGEEERTKLAINSGILELVVILHESCCALPDGCHIAARVGLLPILQFLHEHGAKADTKVKVDVIGEEHLVIEECACAHAAAGGNLACLEYLHKCGCPWGDNALYPAICNGQTACVEYAILHGCPVNNFAYCIVAVRKGHLDILKLLHAAGAPWYEPTCAEAAYTGHLDCLQYLHENGCSWNKNTCMEAFVSGHLDCFTYAQERGCEWDSFTFSGAADQGNLPDPFENGFPWD